MLRELLDKQGAPCFAMTDAIAERARTIGGATRHSISDVARHQRVPDNNNADVTPQDMFAELCAGHQQLTRFLRATHAVYAQHNDVTTASVREHWIDATERRT